MDSPSRFGLPDAPQGREADGAPPAGIPEGHEQHVDLMYDLMAMAFQTDSTRVVSYCVAPEGSNRPFPTLGISEGHHYLTHHQGNQEKVAKVAKKEGEKQCALNLMD